MKLIKKIIICILIFFIILMNMKSFATVQVTEEKLVESLKKFSREIEIDYNITIGSENHFIISNVGIEEKEYKVNYDLSSEKPRFYIENFLENEIFPSLATQNAVTSLSFGYMAIAVIQGYEKDYEMLGALMYVFDDYDKNFNAKQEDKFDEFFYEDSKELTYTDKYNTYTLNLKKEKKDDNTESEIIELVVNPMANFSKINQYFEQTNNVPNVEETKDTTIKTEIPVSTPTPNNMSKIPYAGLEINKYTYILVINLMVLIVTLVKILIQKNNSNNR